MYFLKIILFQHVCVVLDCEGTHGVVFQKGGSEWAPGAVMFLH